MKPLTFHPLLKRIRWGGQRLGSILHKPIGPETDYAESWEIADHGADQTFVSRGEFSGLSLSELVNQQNVPLLGRHSGKRQFPLLVKFLDATDVLSVQVHPDDQLARQFHPTENGKTEAWVILDTHAHSEIFVGLRSGVTESDLKTALHAGTVEQLLNRVPVKAGDCVFVPAGTVHAIGEGVLLAEVQQSSDMTFRLYDWGRVGADGQPRQLHLEAALQCVNFDRGPIAQISPVKLNTNHDHEELVRSAEFVLQRHRSSDPFDLPQDEAFHVVMVLSGNGELQAGGDVFDLSLGQTVLLPADRDHVVVTPGAELTLLDTFLP